METIKNLYIGIERLNLPIEPDMDVIQIKYPEYLIYVNYHNLSLYSSSYEILNEDYPGYLKQPYIVQSPICLTVASIKLEYNKCSFEIPVVIEAHENAKMFYLKLYMDADTQQHFYRYIYFANNPTDSKIKHTLSEEEYNEAAKRIVLPEVLVSTFSRLKYLPEHNPMTTSMTDIPTLIKYSNLLIDDLIECKAIRDNSKYNTI